MNIQLSPVAWKLHLKPARIRRLQDKRAETGKANLAQTLPPVQVTSHATFVLLARGRR